MSDLIISLIQSDIYWENIDANLAMFEEKIWEVEGDVDLIVLPEMFNTGFSMKPEKLAEVPGLKTQKFMIQMAKQKQALVMGSYMVNDKGSYFNRLLAAFPDGHTEYYDKRNLFVLSEEKAKFTPGITQVIISYKGWKICPQVCFDLRFPVCANNTVDQNGEYLYDLLINTANWPASRVGAWETLLSARAIESQSYTLGVNRVGVDGNEIKYSGQSSIHNMEGVQLGVIKNIEGILIQKLSKDYLYETRNKFPFLIQG